MGHIVNSVSYRLGNSRYFNNVWFNHNTFNYSYLANQDILIYRFFNRVLGHRQVALKGIILSNIKIIRNFNTLNIYVHIHDSCFELWIYDFKARNGKIFRTLTSYTGDLIKKKLKRKFKVSRGNKFFDLNINLITYWFIVEHVMRRGWFVTKSLLLRKLRCFINSHVNLHLIGLSRIAISAGIVAEYFRIRLVQYYTVWEVLRSVNYLFKTMMRKGVVIGYKISCSGRFSRKQRTTYTWKTLGRLGSASIKARLDYNYRTLALKYSACTIKIWVRLGTFVRKNLIEFVL